MKITSKVNTLRDVKSKATLFRVPPLLGFQIDDFKLNPTSIIEEIQNTFNGYTIVIRSSAADEDGDIKTLAGQYDSVLNVSSSDSSAIDSAIKIVIASYEKYGSYHNGNQVFAQEMVLNTSMSGVIFTHELNTGAPYYVINYDDVSGLTDSVTSGGNEYANRTLYVHRSALTALRSERFQRLIEAVQELEILMDNEFLDIEFALGADFTPYLLQVRSITTQANWNRGVSNRIDATLKGIQSLVQARMKPIKGVYGDATVLGQMPDWNPAEMIGRAPRALSFSLYKTLITDNAWRIAREQMGYATPVGQPLMLSLAGQPFIDARLSFHSFLPKDLSEEICHKLVNGWVQRLRSHPELHDKIEFDVAITTFSFDIDSKMEELVGNILTLEEKVEFKESLRKQTCRLLADLAESGISGSLTQIGVLAKKQAEWVAVSATGHDISELFAMIDDCINFGTIPFSILARHGFIAKTILMSLNYRGILTMEDIDKIQSGVRTVASDLVKDMHQLQCGYLSRVDFMAQYGHLRPGTYDILSHRYDQMAMIGKEDLLSFKEEEPISFVLSAIQKKQIDCLLQQEGFQGFNAEKLLDYIQAATVGREYGKFVFTRSVSDMLELMADFGEENNLSREELSHVSVKDLIDVITRSKEISTEEYLRHISEVEAEHHALSVMVRLPQVLVDEQGVHVIPFQVSCPNFITKNTITAPCAILSVHNATSLLNGKIVLIESADPGFDWIFSKQIVGLITKYGGANSHMAIRCAEFEIPAAIGCGEQRFE
ncbi:MAG: PEP/pyruvate-binding domain-containing protein, partial [Candidatus Thioglobus sp.]